MTVARSEKRRRQKESRARHKAKLEERRAELARIMAAKDLGDRDVQTLREHVARSRKRGVASAQAARALAGR